MTGLRGRSPCRTEWQGRCGSGWGASLRIRSSYPSGTGDSTSKNRHRRGTRTLTYFPPHAPTMDMVVVHQMMASALGANYLAVLLALVVGYLVASYASGGFSRAVKREVKEEVEEAGARPRPLFSST